MQFEVENSEDVCFLDIKELRDLNYIYRKLIVFLCIVVWHMRVSARWLHVSGYSAGCYDVIKNAAKNIFLIQILKIRLQIIVTAKR